MAFSIQRTLVDVVGSMRNLEESHPYACTRRARADAGSIKLTRSGGGGAPSHGDESGALHNEEDIVRIWDRRPTPSVAHVKDVDASWDYLVQWEGCTVEQAVWESTAALINCHAALHRFEEEYARIVAALPPSCRPPPLPPLGTRAEKASTRPWSSKGRPARPVAAIAELSEATTTGRRKRARQGPSQTFPSPTDGHDVGVGGADPVLPGGSAVAVLTPAMGTDAARGPRWGPDGAHPGPEPTSPEDGQGTVYQTVHASPEERRDEDEAQ